MAAVEGFGGLEDAGAGPVSASGQVGSVEREGIAGGEEAAEGGQNVAGAHADWCVDAIGCPEAEIKLLGRGLRDDR